MYGRNIYSDQDVYLGKLGEASMPKLLGVQSFDGDWALPVETISAAGHGPVAEVINGSLEGNVSISRYVTRASDPITGLLTVPLSGKLTYDKEDEVFTKAFSFSRAYIDSFSSDCSVGDIATADVGITVYGGISNATGETSTPVEAVEIARAGDISLNVNGYETNAVQSYAFGVTIGRTPVDTLGNNFKPTDFIVNYPIEATVDFDIIVNDYESSGVYEQICSPIRQDLSINLNTCSGTNIRKFSLSNARLISYNTNAGIGDNMGASLSYIKYLKTTGELAALFQ